MATSHRLLRALADRPEELALLLRSEYRPGQTLLHHAAAQGDAALLAALLAFDPSLASVEVSEGALYERELRRANALMSAVAGLQPAAVRALLPHSWPQPRDGGGQPNAAQQAQQAAGSCAATSGSREHFSTGSRSPGALVKLATCQTDLLARLLHSVACYEQWPMLHHGVGHRHWRHWPAPPQLPIPDLRQRAEATLVALLEGPHGIDINVRIDAPDAEMYLHGAMEFAVADCPPWAALMLLRHGASPTGYKCDLATLLLNVARRRHPGEGDVELLAALLQAGAPASSTAVCELAELACDCNAAGDGLEAHMRYCRAMLSLLLQHGASLEVPANERSLLQLAADRLVDSIGRNTWDKHEPPAAHAAAALLEDLTAALGEAGYHAPHDMAGFALQFLQNAFHVKPDSIGIFRDCALWDAASVQRCLRALQAVCAPSSAAQAQHLLHESIRWAVCSAFSGNEGSSYGYRYRPARRLELQDWQRELSCWLAAMRFAVEQLGVDPNGSPEGPHPLRSVLSLADMYRWRYTTDNPQWIPVAASELLALLVELGAKASHDMPAEGDKPLLWLALDMWTLDIVRLILAAGSPAASLFRGQTALQYLFDGSEGWNVGCLIRFLTSRPDAELRLC